MRPMLPSWIRSSRLMPRPMYFLATLTTRRRLASVSLRWPSSASHMMRGFCSLSGFCRSSLPRSMRLASATSSAAESSGTRPISRRYMRTGSSMAPSISAANALISSRSSSHLWLPVDSISSGRGSPQAARGELSGWTAIGSSSNLNTSPKGSSSPSSAASSSSSATGVSKRASGSGAGERRCAPNRSPVRASSPRVPGHVVTAGPVVAWLAIRGYDARSSTSRASSSTTSSVACATALLHLIASGMPWWPLRCSRTSRTRLPISRSPPGTARLDRNETFLYYGTRQRAFRIAVVFVHGRHSDCESRPESASRAPGRLAVQAGCGVERAPLRQKLLFALQQRAQRLTIAGLLSVALQVVQLRHLLLYPLPCEAIRRVARRLDQPLPIERLISRHQRLRPRRRFLKRRRQAVEQAREIERIGAQRLGGGPVERACLGAGEIAIRDDAVDLGPHDRIGQHQPQAFLFAPRQHAQPAVWSGVGLSGAGRTIRRARTCPPTFRVLFSQPLDRRARLVFGAVRLGIALSTPFRPAARLAVQLAAHLCEVVGQMHFVEPNLLRQPADIFIRQRAVAHLGDDRQQAARRLDLAVRRGQVQVGGLRLDQEVNQRLRLLDGPLPARRVAPHVFIWVFVRGQSHDGDLGVHLFLEAHQPFRLAPAVAHRARCRAWHRHMHPVERLLGDGDAAHHCRFTGGVWVERERDTARELLDLLDVLVGDRATDAGDDVAEAILMRDECVHVAFDDHHLASAADALAG